MRQALSLLGAAVVGLALACAGDPGPQGPPGPAGAHRARPVTPVPSSCPGGDGGIVTAALSVSTPTNGQFFTAGEQPVVTITFSNGCGTVPPASLGSTADFFVVGPRAPLATVTAYKLLNLSPAPFTAQGLKPLADGGTPNPNMTVQANGTVVYTLNPITSEAPGTYTASVWAIGQDPLNQMFVLAGLPDRDRDGRDLRVRRAG